MQKVTRIVAVALVVLALIMAVVAISVGKRGTRTTAAAGTSEPTPSLPVVVATRELAAGTAIPGDALQIVDKPQRPPGAYTRIDQVAGRVPAQHVPSGSILTATMIARGLGLQLNPGERAIAVPVDELTGAGNRVAPGDYVDVFLNLGDSRRAAAEDVPGQARLLLSRVRVLGYGADDLDRRAAAAEEAPAPPPAEADSSPASGTAPNRSDSRRARALAERGDEAPYGSPSSAAGGAARSAILAVPVEDASSLLLGAQTGKLFLALRSPVDDGLADASLFPRPRKVLAPRADLGPDERAALGTPENEAFAGIDSRALSGNASAAVQAPPPARTAATGTARRNGIEIIRGDGQGSRLSPP